MPKTVLAVKNLNVKLGGEEILKDLSFEVKEGEVLVILGPNGAGKTVLFRALLGLIPYEGEIKWQKNIRIGYVPQRFNVGSDFPLTVEEFLQLAPPKNPREALFRNLRLVGFSGNEHHLEHHVLGQRIGLMSAGELQRILIASALMDKPDVLLFDEPMSGVDISSEKAIYERLRGFNKDAGFTLLLISHDLSVVYRWATTVLCLNRKALCIGKPHAVIESDILKKLYGTEKAFYKHKH